VSAGGAGNGARLGPLLKHAAVAFGGDEGGKILPIDDNASAPADHGQLTEPDRLIEEPARDTEDTRGLTDSEVRWLVMQAVGGACET
jgi:hypothetical protein